MLIQLHVNRDAIQKNNPDLIWVIRIPGKTIFAKLVIIDAIGITVYNPDPAVKPNAYLEFEADLQKGSDGEYAIVPITDGKPIR